MVHMDFTILSIFCFNMVVHLYLSQINVIKSLDVHLSDVCELAVQYLKRPFYSCVFSDLALDWKRGWVTLF